MTQGIVAARRLVLVMACALLGATIGVANASAAPATVLSGTFDGVQVDSPGAFPGSLGGPTLHLGAFEARTVFQPSGEVIRTTDIVLLVGEEECFEFNGGGGCQQIWEATCVPATSDVLVLGPRPTQAAIRGTFECTRGDGTTFPLNVDLVWSASTKDIENAVFPWHPAEAGVQGGAFAGVRVLAEVTGSVSDGTIEFLPPDATGYITHATDTQVFVP